MSRQLTPHYANNKGAIIRDPVRGILLAYGTGAPTASLAGYAVGAIFIRTDGGVDTVSYVNVGSLTSASWVAQPSTVLNSLAALTATAAELNKTDDSLSTVIGFTKGAGVSAMETYSCGVMRIGGLVRSTILIDITGLVGSATDTDIIGNTGGATSAHLGQVTTAINGTMAAGRVTCLEVPAGGTADIAFWSANESTGAQDALITSLVETLLTDPGGAWTTGATRGLTTVPPANDFLYIANGAASGGTFTAGKFLIELFGTA